MTIIFPVLVSKLASLLIFVGFQCDLVCLSYYYRCYKENTVDIFKVVLLLNSKLTIYMGGSENILFSVSFMYLIKPKAEVTKAALLIAKKIKIACL